MSNARSIWKFPLEITDLQEVLMPKGAEILTVQMQEQTLCIWAKVNPEKEFETEIRKIRIIGTGHKFNDENLKYIGTTQMYGGGLIWHVFEVIK